MNIKTLNLALILGCLTFGAQSVMADEEIIPDPLPESTDGATYGSSCGRHCS